MLQTNRLYLRPLTPDDASDRYIQWLNDPVVNRYLETKSSSTDELRRYISDKQANPTCIFFGIFLKEDNRHIGNIKLDPVDLLKNEATIGILIGDRIWWGKGICTEVINEVVRFAFSEIYLKTLVLGVLSENTAAISCYKKAGFTIETTEKYKGVNANGKQYTFIMRLHNKENKTGEQTI